MNNYFKQYSFLVKEYSNKFWKLISLFLISGLLDFIGIGLIGPFISIALNDNAHVTDSLFSFGLFNDLELSIYLLGFLVIFIFFCKGFISFWIQRKIIIFSANVEKDIKMKLLKKFFRTSYFIQEDKDSSKQVNLINNHSKLFASETLMQSLRLVSDTIVIMAILILLFRVSFNYALSLIFLFVVAYFFYDSFVKGRIRIYGEMVTKTSQNIISIVRDSVIGKQELKVYRKEFIMMKILSENTIQYANSMKKYLSLKVIPKYALEFLMVTFVVSIILISLFSKSEPKDVFAVLSIFAVAAMRVIPTSNQMIVSANSMRFSSYVLNELYEELIVDDEKNIEQKNINSFSSLELKNVSFHYNGNLVFDNINLKINKGDSFCISGKSGVGKSTLVKIILGLLRPSSGEVRINNEIINYEDDSYLELFSYIPQKLLLMNDSIKNNILFGDKLVSENSNAFQNALIRSNLNETLLNFDDGIDTHIGEVGSKISGGQGQRVGLARAFFHQRDVIVFDEATSSLDEDLETKIYKDITSNSNGFTSIIITHNPNIVKLCSKTFNL
tara:strand:+ start:5062 stop:6732 length:1671 start_codon:yes stop_codon:yes gene_type:complete